MVGVDPGHVAPFWKGYECKVAAGPSGLETHPLSPLQLRIPSSQFYRLAVLLGPLTGDMLGTTRQGAADSIGVLLRSIHGEEGQEVSWWC